MDLQNPTKKMSKSDETYKGVILLLDDEKTIRKKIMSAVTDSESKVYYNPETKPGISNLLIIYSSLKEISIKDAEEHFKDYNYGNLKKEVADLVVEVLTNIQTKYNELINSTGKVMKEVNKEMKDAGAYLLVHCGGRRLGIGDRINEVATQLKKEAKGKPFIAVFTFGEYGVKDHGANTTGGLMLSFTAFGK